MSRDIRDKDKIKQHTELLSLIDNHFSPELDNHCEVISNVFHIPHGLIKSIVVNMLIWFFQEGKFILKKED